MPPLEKLRALFDVHTKGEEIGWTVVHTKKALLVKYKTRLEPPLCQTLT